MPVARTGAFVLSMPKFDAGGKHDPSSSIAARDPKRAAEVLAELMGGSVIPFPPNPGSFFALQLDEHGSGVEVYPAGTKLQPGGVTGGTFVKKCARGNASTPIVAHFT